MSDPRFIHLRVHSDFSLVHGLQKVKPLCQQLARLGMPAMALTDEMNMFGLVGYYQAARANGIKPIIGADLHVLDESLKEQPTRLTALAMNEQGYQHIKELLSLAYLQGHRQGKPCIDQAWLAEHNEGIILLSGGHQGLIGRALLQQDEALLEQQVQFYQTYFPNRFYVEISRTGRAQEENYLHEAVQCAATYGLPLVATNDVMFLHTSDFDAHEIRVAIHTGHALTDKKRPKDYTEEQYLRTVDEMVELFHDLPEALTNTVEIAKRCNVELELGTNYLPHFPTEGYTEADFLVMKSEEGLEERLEFLFPDEAERQAARPAYDERLKIELDVINSMEFPGYFLVVMEFIQWSKANGIPVGPGRGSGAGSLVAYALKITDLDPLKYDLLFERFLNPERVSMPDFDVDFCMDRRDEVIEHVAQMYGQDAVSQIITFGSMAAKAVIRDVGRVMSLPYGLVDSIAKLIPNAPGTTLKKAFEEEPMLEQKYQSETEIKQLIDMARRLEGVYRNAGKHAGGVVISPSRIVDFAPLYCDEYGHHPVTQFDKDDIESAGLVKFDFLGLKTLTVIQWAVDMVNDRRAQQQQEPLQLENLPLDDTASYSLLKRGETLAVFQLESDGMKKIIVELLPDTFEDIVALVALYRPGPLNSGMVDNFINRKHGKEAISYPDETYQHDSLKPILQSTYGVILYQEQVMQIAQVLAGYSLGGADLLRRAMGKKKPEEMEQQRGMFESGAIDNGIDAELAMKIFDLVEKFAGYGFNKSHSAAYALVAYQTLWLKTHYPSEYLAAVLSAEMDNTDKIVMYIEECWRMGLTVRAPNINQSILKFSVNDEQEIIYGLGAIKGVGSGPVENILQARASGPFKNLFDFCERIDTKKTSKRVIERLIKAGALDEFSDNRAALVASLETALKFAAQQQKDAQSGQIGLFGFMETEASKEEDCQLVDIRPWSEEEVLQAEKETLGLYLSGHPMDRFEEEVAFYTSKKLDQLEQVRGREQVTLAGMISRVDFRVNKRGQKWAILTLDDATARMQMRIFSDVLSEIEDLLQPDALVWLRGEVSFDPYNQSNTITIQDLMSLEKARTIFVKSIDISVQFNQENTNQREQLVQILQHCQRGACPVQFHCELPDAYMSLVTPSNWHVDPTDALLNELKHIVGVEQVSLNFNA